ncbi:cyclic nucleotide-binding domain-containing protein [Rhodobacterales bacterium HKCCSP123]|nr:cyclic nucleotide-binding domain-containing protein [Rhodobacterales bacterium HKCCSP123]
MVEDIHNGLKTHIHTFWTSPPKTTGVAHHALRVFCLREGERIIFPSTDPDDFTLLANGDVIVDGKERITVHAENSGEMYRFPSRDGDLSLEAVGTAVVCRGNDRTVEELLALEELGRHDHADGAEAPRDILLKLRGTETFRRLPMENAYQALQRMKRLRVASGDEIVRQYEEGDAYYIISEGKAEVWREDLDDDEPRKVAVLGPGDAFGEESLVMNGSRNATVKMITEGEVLQLKKDDFDELISTSLIEKVKPAAAQALMEAGSRILDVRYQEEYEAACIPGSLWIPLPDLRSRMDELEGDTSYLVLCKKGSRASAATLLLKQRGFKAVVIEGGIEAWPGETGHS